MHVSEFTIYYGTDVYRSDNSIRRIEWKVQKTLNVSQLNSVTFLLGMDCNKEYRPGGLNFSILGRSVRPGWHRDEYA